MARGDGPCQPGTGNPHCACHRYRRRCWRRYFCTLDRSVITRRRFPHAAAACRATPPAPRHRVFRWSRYAISSTPTRARQVRQWRSKDGCGTASHGPSGHRRPAATVTSRAKAMGMARRGGTAKTRGEFLRALSSECFSPRSTNFSRRMGERAAADPHAAVIRR